MLANAVPAHVPPERVRDFDFLDLGDDSDVHQHFKRLHDDLDFFYTPRHGGHWVATRFDDMEQILLDNEAFSSEHSSLPREGKPMRVPLLESDEPMHRDYRSILQPFFMPKQIAMLENEVRSITIELIERFRAAGECEFVADFALRMPIGIFMRLVDLPDADREYLIRIAVDLVRGNTPEIQMGGFQRAFEYLAGTVAERRAKPGNDVLSALIQGTVEGGRPLQDMELLGLGSLLLAAGLDTVAAALSFMMNFLARNPEHRRQIADDPGCIPEAAEELLRRHHVTNIARIVIRDMSFKDVELKAGDAILIPTTLAGIDDRRFPDPMTVDFNRSNKRHLLFGRGPHQCVGQFLARAETRIFLQEWFARIPDFEITDGKRAISVPGRANGMLHLPLSWPTA